MSDDTTTRPSLRAQRPADVTDPLLWQLAVDVLDAHQPDDDGVCVNLLCAGQHWPCAARNHAERSLLLSRGAADALSTVALTTGEDGNLRVQAAAATRPARPAGLVSAGTQAAAPAA